MSNHIIISRAKRPSGLIASAKTYRIELEDGMLHLIHIGPAGNRVRTPNAIANMAVKKVYAAIDKKIKAGEQELAEKGRGHMLAKKHSFSAALGELDEVEVKKNYAGEPMLVVKGKGKKIKLILNGSAPDEVQALKRAISPLAPH